MGPQNSPAPAGYFGTNKQLKAYRKCPLARHKFLWFHLCQTKLDNSGKETEQSSLRTIPFVSNNKINGSRKVKHKIQAQNCKLIRTCTSESELFATAVGYDKMDLDIAYVRTQTFVTCSDMTVVRT